MEFCTGRRGLTFIARLPTRDTKDQSAPVHAGLPYLAGGLGALLCRSSLEWNDHTALLASCIASRKGRFAAMWNTEIGSSHRSTPRDRVVTGIAFGRCRNMLRMLAGRRHAVVTARTGTENLKMIHTSDWRPHNRVVAVFTQIRCRYVIDWLAHGNHTVVTGKAS